MEISTAKKVLLMIAAIPILLAIVVVLVPLILLYLVYEKIKFIGAPGECCQAGCSTCPWGDITHCTYRSSYKKWRETHKITGRPRVNKKGEFVR